MLNILYRAFSGSLNTVRHPKIQELKIFICTNYNFPYTGEYFIFLHSSGKHFGKKIFCYLLSLKYQL